MHIQEPVLLYVKILVRFLSKQSNTTLWGDTRDDSGPSIIKSTVLCHWCTLQTYSSDKSLQAGAAKGNATVWRVGCRVTG